MRTLGRNSKYKKNKEVLLRERKRHSDRHVASTSSVVLMGGGYPIPGPGPDGGTPSQVQTGGTLSQVQVQTGGTPSQFQMGGTPSQVQTGAGGTPSQV